MSAGPTGSDKVYDVAGIPEEGESDQMDHRGVRAAVKEFRERTGATTTNEHCFAPWYLHQVFEVADSQAMEQSSDGNFDFGIDAFHLHGGDPPSKLLLVQAKFTDSLSQIASGFRGLEKGLPEVARALEGVGTESPNQNKVLVNLRAAVGKLEKDRRQSLELDLEVLHLSPEDKTIVGNRTREARGRLREGIAKYVGDHVCNVRDIAPTDLGLIEETYVPPVALSLSIEGAHEFTASSGVRVFYGIGRLADLVDLYTRRRDQLFSRNVRYYLFSKKNVEKGPAGKMRETLKQICIEKSLDPELFAAYHNGVTIYAQQVRKNDGSVSVREPFVLNGCQTIKNAYFFRNEPILRGRIEDALWQRIRIPIRILETGDDALVRTVTINNNRQNAITPADLRSNDPVQIRLEEQFQERGIFYERQEGAYENLEASNATKLQQEFWNSRRGPVRMIDIGRSLTAVAGDIGLAEHPNDLFESDAAYERCFNEKRISSLVFLTFLQNLHGKLGVILKNDLNLNQQGDGPNPIRLKYYTMCLLVRYIVKAELREAISEFGTSVYDGDWTFRREIDRLIRSPHSGIRRELAARFMTLETSDAPSLNEAFERTQNVLRLRRNLNPFEAFEDLDQQVDNSNG